MAGAGPPHAGPAPPSSAAAPAPSVAQFLDTPFHRRLCVCVCVSVCVSVWVCVWIGSVTSPDGTRGDHLHICFRVIISSFLVASVVLNQSVWL